MMSASTVNLLCLVLGSFLVVETAKRDLPAYIERCKLNDPNINGCLLKATEKVKPYLIKGIPEINFPPIEPFHIPKITLEQGTRALNFKAELQNVTVKGLSNYKFSQFDFDVPNLQWFCKCVIEPIDLEGDYTVTGRILIAPIQGKGRFVAGISSTNVTAYQKCKTIIKRGEEYLNPILTNTSIEVGGPKVSLDGLFDGNQELSKVTNQVITDNVQILFEDLKPVIEKIITTILQDALLRSIEDNVPFSKMYPKD